jgi:hypothetical protein
LQCAKSASKPLGPAGSVERPALNGFGGVLGFDGRGVFDVGDGARDFEDAVMSAGAESLLGYGALADEAAAGVEDSGYAVNLGGLKRHTKA